MGVSLSNNWKVNVAIFIFFKSRAVLFFGFFYSSAGHLLIGMLVVQSLDSPFCMPEYKPQVGVGV